MVKVVPFRCSDLIVLKEKGAMAMYGQYVTEENVIALEDNVYSVTLVDEQQEVVAVGGAIELWETRAHLWLIIDPDKKAQFYQIHNAVKRYINTLPFKRCEATVDVDFEQGNRWMPLLKFEREGLLRCYGIDGSDVIMYAKIKD